MKLLHIICCFSLILTGCFLLQPKFSKLYKKDDFWLYQPHFSDTSGPITYNGVYLFETDSLIGFLRFFRDGKVVTGGCSGAVTNPDNNDCFDNPSRVSNNGYYMVRNDTLILELADNGPIGAGIIVRLFRLRGDTLTHLSTYNRTTLKRDLTVFQTQPLDYYNRSYVFVQMVLRDSTSKDW